MGMRGRKDKVCYGKHWISKDWHPTKSGEYEYKTVLHGNEHWGELHRLPDKTVEYWAKRTPEQKVRNLNDGWAIDKTTYSLVGRLGAKFIRVLTSTGELYSLSYEEFTDRKEEWNYEGHIGVAPGAKGKLGAPQWAVKGHLWDYKGVVSGAAFDDELMTRIMIKGKWDK